MGRERHGGGASTAARKAQASGVVRDCAGDVQKKLTQVHDEHDGGSNNVDAERDDGRQTNM